jgi:alpha-aminoadipate carrier protein LysW
MHTPDTALEALCPVCDAPVGVAADVVVAEIIVCRECGTDLEVTGLDPLQLAEAPMEAEDWGE